MSKIKVTIVVAVIVAGSAVVISLLFRSSDPQSISHIVSFVDILVKILTGLAIIVGGIWTYYNFIQGRIYYPKLEPKIDLAIVERGASYYLRASVHAKNVGLSRVSFKQESSFVTFCEFPEMGLDEDMYAVESNKLSTFEVFKKHDWIEPNELISDHCLVVVPRKNQVAFGANVYIVGVRHGYFGSRRSFTWNVDQIALVDPEELADQDKKGRQDETETKGSLPTV